MDRAAPAPRAAANALTFALLVLVTSAGIQAFSMPVADNDLWGHVYFGREILRSGLPERNLYSYTAPDHPWINHEILAESAFATAYDHGGAFALVLLKVIVGLSTLAFMLASARRRTREPFAWAASLVLTSFLMSWGYLVRPQIFSFLALAILWHQLQRSAAGERSALWLLPALFAAWVNTHGGVLAGIAILGVCTILSSLSSASPISPVRDRTTEGQARETGLALVFAASCAALLINPYGVDLLAFLVGDVLRDRAITEWAPIPVFDSSNLAFKLTALFVVAAAVRSRRRQGWELAVIGLAGLATFRHERHLPLFAIVAAPLLAESFGQLIISARRRFRAGAFSPGAAVTIALAITAVAVLQLAAVWRIHRTLEFGIFVAPELFPVQAVRFIRENGLRGNLALPFDWGEYAIWHLYPACRVSVDGRYTTAYPDEILTASLGYVDGADGAERVLGAADLALAGAKHGIVSRLLADRAWRQIYADATAVLFARARADHPAQLSPPSPVRVRDIVLFP